MTTMKVFPAIFVFLSLFGNYFAYDTTTPFDEPPINQQEPFCGRVPSPPYIPWLVSIKFPWPHENSSLALTSNGIIVSNRVVLTYGRDYYDIFAQNITTLKVFAGAKNWFRKGEQQRNIIHRFLTSNPIDSNDQNVAVLIVDPPFEFDWKHVAPVCLDFSANTDLVGKNGTLAAFRHQSGGITSHSYTVLNNSECVSTNKDIELELTLGRFCARTPATVGQGPYCAMVLGTGLVIHKTVGEEQISYLVGLARQSFGENIGNARCNDGEYQLFVNVNQYRTEIENYIADYQ